jgi:hypothetical protein
VTSSKALLTPEEELKRKAAIFETSVAEFKSERKPLGDSLAMDCKQLLKDLNAETDCVWGEARRELHQLVDDISDFSIEPTRARERITTNLSRYFAIALEDSVRSFQVKLGERLSVDRARSDALVNFVHQTATDLMEISVKLPRSGEAFQPRREPYWVAPEPAISPLDLTGSVAEGFLPRAIREKRARARIIAEAEKAALLNVANLDWTMRQNIEDSFRRFELSFLQSVGRSAEGNPSGNAIGAATPHRAVGSHQSSTSNKRIAPWWSFRIFWRR